MDTKVATFDCYGTLIDWEGGAASFLYEIARRHEPDPPPGRALRERWEELQFEHLTGPYRAYREVLAHSLADWAAERGYRWNEHDGEAMARSMASWQPFPDTVPALRHLEVEFDGVTVAEDCRGYKPGDRPFSHALGQIHADRSEILHVAFGFKYDLAAAQRHGLQTAWVNRHREQRPGPELPDREWSDLWPLVDVARGG
jgi:FMN phosphatase YigB (HAD superfamily)